MRRLREFYGLLPEPPSDLFQFVIWEILSRDALPARRDIAWLALRRIPALTPDAVFRAKAKDLQAAVDHIGSRRDERIDQIRATVGEFKRHREELTAAAAGKGTLLRAARGLRRLSQIDRAVQQRALLFAGEYCVIPVDDEIARTAGRLAGLEPRARFGMPPGERARTARTRDRREARKVLAASLPRDVEVYKDAALYLRHHALSTCVVVDPHCGICPLASACVFAINSKTRPAAEEP